MKLIYYSYGGIILVSSSIAFVYFTLFKYQATLTQWFSAAILGVIGMVFLFVANELEHKQYKLKKAVEKALKGTK